MLATVTKIRNHSEIATNPTDLSVYSDYPSMDAIFGSGLRGIQIGFQQAAESADKITRAFQPDSTEDAVQPMIDLAGAKRQVEASSKVIKVGDELMGAILDIIG